ncbi:MAG TPA: hypothetical protein VEC56_08230 [Candidatus Krumholzibacteria bacterium]|nr:hypothetical protein [Candidatus Krumholzibacteria bacterium]
MSKQSRQRIVISLLFLLACVAGIVWYAESRRARPDEPRARPQAPPPASLTFDGLVDSAETLGAQFRLALGAIPRHDEPRRLQSTLDYLQSVTYLYYDWASGRGEEAISAEGIQRGYVMPAVESIARARPELAEAHPGLRSAGVVSLYFLDHKMLLTLGLVLSTSGLGRFPSLELAPIAREVPMDQVVWGRRIDAAGFDLREPIILDIVSWSHGASTGANMRTAGTVVVHHLDREAEFVETLRGEIQHARHGPPDPPHDAPTLMRGLVYVALQPYLALDDEGAVRQFMKDWSEASYMHEAGHVFSRQAGLGLTPQTAQEEALAYLTELRFGGMPHYTLRNMVSVGMVEGIRPHKDGMEVVFAEFSQHIFAATMRGDGFEAIDFRSIAESAAPGAGFGAIAFLFPKLRADEIRALADRVFEEKYRHLVKE